MSSFGVIDLGTNTFHLLIVEAQEDGSFIEKYRKRFYVKLAADGIESIGPKPFIRGLSALRHFRAALDKYQIKHFKAIGTAALRTASNGQQFIQQAFEVSQIPIGLISGEEEARLIHLGTMRTFPKELVLQNSLIMDIGGGSVEFIIANQTTVFWSASYPVGVSILYQKFYNSDPIAKEDIVKAKDFLSQQLKELKQQLKLHPTPLLVGASGAFEVVESFLVKMKINANFSMVEKNAFLPLFDQLRFTTLKERLKFEALPPSRAEMIIVSFILIELIIEWTNCSHIAISGFAMKEGILTEMINNNV